MSDFDYDYFVIGGGSAGVRSSRIAAGHGARVGLAEEYRIGGTCVIRGCVPKKMLVYGAYFAEDLADARRFGWTIDKASFDWPTLRDHVLADVDRLNRGYTQTLDSHGVAHVNARARFIDAHTLDVGGERVTAKHILIATGARPELPDVPGIEHAITSNECFHLDALPESMLIVGSGYIANEFAGIFHEFGVEVTLMARGSTILKGWDHSLAERLLAISTAKGINFRLNCGIARIEADGAARCVTFADGRQARFGAVMFAIGRAPNTQGLGLEAAGVAVDARGAIKVDDDCRTTQSHIFAAGDVIDRVQLTPVAIREGHAVADHLFAGKPIALDYGCIPSAVFSHPPLASVGLAEGAARNRLGNIRVYSSDFRPMKHVLAGREERALMKLVVDSATDRIVGAHMIGPDAAEIMQTLAVAVKAGLTKAQLDQTVAIHPTMAEEWVLLR
jgi:glutathione reductase (NADPH)